jgi:hypothetical protein
MRKMNLVLFMMMKDDEKWLEKESSLRVKETSAINPGRV